MRIRGLLFYIFIFCLFTCLNNKSYAQIVSHDAEFGLTTSGQPVQLTVGGYLDGNNCKQLITYWPHNVCKYYLSAFEPAQNITLTNQDTVRASSLSIVFNDTGNWYTLEKTANEVFKGAVTAKDKAMAVYNFVSSKHMYFYTPDFNNKDENQSVSKFLSVYGYGHCGNIANAVTFLTGFNTGLPQYYWVVDGGEHGVADVMINDTTMMIDADEQGYYLKWNNRSLASFREVTNDMYLYYRTKHFGALYPYYPDVFASFASLFMMGNNYPEPYLDAGSPGPDMYFSLRPGESISYLWNLPVDSVLYHQIVLPNYGEYPSTDDVKNVIGNGEFSLQTDFISQPFYSVVDAAENITVNTTNPALPTVYSNKVGGSSFVVSGSSPYVIVDGKVKCSFYNKSVSDKIKIYYSSDSLNWSPIWESALVGNYTDSIELSDQIAALTDKGVYKYYLKFEFSPALSPEDCGIDSLVLTSRFQISEFFMPHLVRGNNKIVVQSETSNQYNLKLHIDWNENFYDRPPAPPAAPVYPANGADIDSTYFTFQWAKSIDPDDYIFDYQFQLSDQPDMKNPLTPMFDRYMSSINVGLASFKPELQGFLNNNTRYYWRVRAMDSRGVLSDWSNVWSFVAHGANAPLNLHFESPANSPDSFRLAWSENLAGLKPANYKVYASEVASGFMPDDDVNLFTQTTVTNSPMSDDPNKSFYRVIAVGSSGNESASSRYVTLPTVVSVNFHDVLATSGLSDTSVYDFNKTFFLYDTSLLVLSGNSFTCKHIGTGIISHCTVNDGDTVYLKQTLVKIAPDEPKITLSANNIVDGVNYSFNITSDGGADVTELGLCWTDDTIPMLDSTGNNKMEVSPSNLESAFELPDIDSPYYLYAYAINSAGVGFSETLPVVVTEYRKNLRLSNLLDTSSLNQSNTILVYDSSFIAVKRNTVIPLRSGLTSISLCTVNDTDTIYLQQCLIRIMPLVQTTLLVHPEGNDKIGYRLDIQTSRMPRILKQGLVWSNDTIPTLIGNAGNIILLDTNNLSGIFDQSMLDSAKYIYGFAVVRGDTVFSRPVRVSINNYADLVQNDSLMLDSSFILKLGFFTYDSSYVKVETDNNIKFTKKGNTVLGYAVKNGADTIYWKQAIVKILPVLPTVSLKATDLKAGNIEYTVSLISDGGDPVTDIGISWGYSPDFIPENSSNNQSIGINNPFGIFSLPFSDSTYYIKAYAINSVGWAYSNTVSFEANTNISVYPNPTNGVVKVSVDEKYRDFILEVYSSNGQLIKKINSASNYTILDLSKYSKGIYFFNIRTKNGMIRKRVVVQ
ncbi:putative secreted protein (Por secretion system target) [Chitinophaga polysaccharea]|uniref:Putative secreted protein (Por secretion system target) n=1 Tax=Chitinophaga polysaccharea TaxID=1293035 RepID=A0A561Q1T9_9BACT|nr:T9SS type A sorting domain-containing protein [Chitinophaga polysaccharea]TWF44337.1 putative secreted protein (Por secretion system target) [Chitinophaga polysaccharea]